MTADLFPKQAASSENSDDHLRQLIGGGDGDGVTGNESEFLNQSPKSSQFRQTDNDSST